jgi:predicted HD superfamily hydrolase involved in NAD metabolism
MDLSLEVPAFLRQHGRDGVAHHVERVAREARRIALREGIHVAAAEAAAYLHDVSLVLPYDQMVAVAHSHRVEVLPEEAQVPALLHGKLSCIYAAERFGLTDPAVHVAMRCHTTLRSGAAPLDKVLFVADKLGWDPADAPYREGLAAALERSLDEAVRHFLAWAWAGRDRMPVIHPWFRAACTEWLSPETKQQKPGAPAGRRSVGPGSPGASGR